MFEVEIVTTGKHFMKGSVVEESLVQVLSRPKPLPLGHVSGMELWKSRTQEVGVAEAKISHGYIGRVDIALMAVAGILILIALLVRLLHRY